MIKRNIYTLIMLLTVGLSAADNLLPYQNPELSPDERARDLVGRMTLEEKVGRMVNGSGPVERLGITEYDWWNEALHGVARAGLATVFPQAIGMAATFDDEAVFKTFDMISDEARAKYHDFYRKGERTGYKGLTFWTPNINIFRDPRWGRGQETYGEDPYLTSRMGIAVVRGLQGDGTCPYDKAHACAKHYAVHSGPEWNRHSFNVENIRKRDLYETYLPAFKALVKDGNVKEVMCAYNSVEGEPCCSNKKLLSQILRIDWGFDGVVVSDCGAIGDFFKPGTHQTHSSPEEAASDAVVSGTDLECVDVSYHTLIDAVKNGLISEDKINESVFRLMRARFQLGMFDSDSLVKWSGIPYSVVDSQEHRDHSLEMARKSMTLLSNSNGILPLDKKLRKIAVVGPNAADTVMMWGNYNGVPSHTVSILDGIRGKVPTTEVIYYRGCDYVKDNNTDFAAVASSVSDADVIVFVGGISPKLEGEEMSVDLPGFKKGDRTAIELPSVQTNMLKALKSTGKPVVFVLCSGSAVALPWVAENVDAVLEAWYPGQAGGIAVADVLFGDYNPAGRLPVTFYASTSDLPDFEDYSMKNRTYRYFQGSPLYPFGHGLSYTTFEYGDSKLAKEKIKEGEDVVITVPLVNTGLRDGDEVVQVYVRRLNSSDAPVKSLAAFRRVHVNAGETMDVELTIPSGAFESYSEQYEDLIPMAGDYEIYYGGSSADSDLKKFTLKYGDLSNKECGGGLVSSTSVENAIGYDSYRGLVMAGYQGWFNAEGDGAGRGFYHYTGKDGFKPGSASIDMWPDVSEYDKTYATAFRMADGSAAKVFSSEDYSTVDTHFKWMKEYGLDGVFMQRFVTEIKRDGGKRHFDHVLASAMKASNKYDRAIAIMYDLSGIGSKDFSLILSDIDSLANIYHLFNHNENPSYLYHNGHPLVSVWGVGFNDGRNYTIEDAHRLVDKLKGRGYSIMIGVPTNWRTLSGDTESNPSLHELIRKCDIVMPWFVGRYNEKSYDRFASNIYLDRQWCENNGLDYSPLVYPGFSWKNMYGENTFNVPRNGGSFFQKQLDGALNAGASMIYVAMFDEIDEGTAIFKCAKDVPLSENGTEFVAIDSTLDNDHYLKLVGETSRLLKKRLRDEKATSQYLSQSSN